jgi:predicted transcriptional regulator of viral defense system
MRGTDYIEHLLSKGRCTFTTDEVIGDLEKSEEAAHAFVYRLRKKGKVATPADRFHVVVPPQYRQLGCLPPQEFVPYLMEHLELDFYAGLLSAASLHGAAHQQPQSFQVMVKKSRPNIECGRVAVEFHQRQRLSKVPVDRINTDYGQLLISTPAATAIDLVGYAHQIGGLNRVATVLTELGDKIDGEHLREVGPVIAPNAWLQRLGYLLDCTGHKKVGIPLSKYIESNVAEVTPLKPERNGRGGMPRSDKWRVAINFDIETDI